MWHLIEYNQITQLIITYDLVGNWVIPLLTIIHNPFMYVAVWHRSRSLAQRIITLDLVCQCQSADSFIDIVQRTKTTIFPTSGGRHREYSIRYLGFSKPSHVVGKYIWTRI